MASEQGCDRMYEGRMCHDSADVRVGFNVWPASVVQAGQRPYVGRLELFVCYHHGNRLTVADVLDTSAKQQMDTHLASRGVPAADWSTAKIALFPLSSRA